MDPPQASVLQDAAVAGIKTWRFNPAQKDGKPIASDEIIPIAFALRPDALLKISGGTLDAIRVSPPEKASAASADRPATEDVTFRIMHPPKYPEEAVKQKLSGELSLKVLVDERGTPQSIDIDHSDPPEAAKVFANASIEAIMQWRFNPAIKDGKPHEGYVLVPITFKIDNE
jgi:TonB family protein